MAAALAMPSVGVSSPPTREPAMATTEQTTTDPRAALLADLPVGERRITVAGVSTAVLEGGDGPPLVLLHGPAAYAAQWRCVIPALAGTHRVIAPDLPGHGASA